MRITSAVLAAACLLTALACSARDPSVFFVDPAPRGFVLPARPIVLFFVDGLRPDVLDDLAGEGRLPRLQRLLFDRGAHARSAVSSVPSVTFANAVSMVTGCFPGTHGAWANVVFDRQQLRTRNYEDARDCAADDDRCPTIFERFDGQLTAGIALPFERGVKISRVQSAGTGGAPFGLAWIMGRKQAADERLADQFSELADEARIIGHWPAFIAVYLPAVDEVGHERGCDSPEYREAVANLDEVIGEVLEAFEAGGMLDELTIVLTADHGFHATPQSIELGPTLAAALGTDVIVAEENDGEVPYLERWKRYAPCRAVVTPNGLREASVSLRAGASWNDRPTLEQILGLPAALGLPAGEDMPARLLSPAVELVAIRVDPDEVRVHGHEGAAAIRRLPSAQGEPLYEYRVLEGDDPLGYGGDDRLRDWLAIAHTSREWLQATADLRHPDVVPQLVEAFDDPRSGDLILFAATGWDFSRDLYLGGHGGIERDEMIVPLWLAGPGIRAGAEVPAARLVDLVPTLLELAGVQTEGQEFDGVSLAQELR